MSTSSITPPPKAAVGDIVYAGANPKAGKTNLDSADFMKLLTAQLSAQDPMNPMKDTEFISQMANFSALENSRALSDSFKTFTSQQSISSAPAFLGKFVTVKTADLGEISGQVDSVSMNNGLPLLTVGGKTYDLSEVTSVSTTAPTVTTAAPTV